MQESFSKIGGFIKVDNVPQVSHAFMTFMKEAPEQQKALGEIVKKLDAASSLDAKTEEIAYISVLAAVRLESGLPFHVKHAKALGATRDEIISAVLLPLPAVGNVVIQALPVALQAYDSE
ncbi:carboxymuconolactone decarboxylase family protein [Paenibacillus sp. FSL R7-0337]|uniref:carboxymuconolactone decarboxylase family protein n=1 Tax=unclassified Paenibacillus TaxID=185978 RepID=UPI0003E2397A|nr:carboxymuconolactone decarboxylase family protein [Paenibacillus sp. FSL R7-0337]ETT48715.1 carboxymuconolactone decarboxylase [Paenibacillus sp. FSL R7-269]OMF99347.1 carboxymuconolactone decarboxylase [Paenibacillus sp. FSL R7-0337]